MGTKILSFNAFQFGVFSSWKYFSNTHLVHVDDHCLNNTTSWNGFTFSFSSIWLLKNLAPFFELENTWHPHINYLPRYFSEKGNSAYYWYSFLFKTMFSRSQAYCSGALSLRIFSSFVFEPTCQIITPLATIFRISRKPAYSLGKL